VIGSKAVGAPLGLREKKKLETRKALLRVARELFLAKGYGATTIEDLARKANVSRATFFKYFSAKSALLTEMVEQIDQRFERRIEQERSRAGSTQQHLTALFLYSAKVIEATKDLSRTLLAEGLASMGQPGGEKLQRMSRMHAALEGLLRDGVEVGTVRRDYPLWLLVEMVASAYTGVLLHWLADPSYPLHKSLRQSARFIGEAIAPRGT